VIQWRHPRPFADCPVRAFKNAHAPSFLGNLQGWLLQLISIWNSFGQRSFYANMTWFAAC
jgi:hypothetical protein